MVKVEQLAAATFAPFGHVARAGEPTHKLIRDNKVKLSKSPAVFRHGDEAVDLALDFYEVQPERAPVRITQAERHEHSAQMFVPMSVTDYLVVVWDNNPCEGGRPHAFLGGPGDVVIYHPGVWHHGIMVIGKPGLFASTMWRTRNGRDVEFTDLPAPLEILVSGSGG